MHGTTPRQVRDYAQTPLNVYWEVTQACGLACRHCRAEAMPEPNPDELSLEEGFAFLRQIPEFGEPRPQLILTGGDPLLRKGLFALIDEAVSLGIGVSITPAATPALSFEMLTELKRHGVEGVGLSLDGPTAEKHDSIRRVAGTYDRTLDALRWAGELELPVQVNTLVSAETAPDLPAVYELLKEFKIARWSLFFLISVGRRKSAPTAHRRGGGGADGVDLRYIEDGPVCHRDDRSPLLPPSGGATHASRRAQRRRDQAQQSCAGLRYPRRPWHRFCLEHRGHLSGGLPSSGGR